MTPAVLSTITIVISLVSIALSAAAYDNPAGIPEVVSYWRWRREQGVSDRRIAWDAGVMPRTVRRALEVNDA